MNFLKSRDWANKVEQDQTANFSECLRLLVFSALNCLIISPGFKPHFGHM